MLRLWIWVKKEYWEEVYWVIHSGCLDTLAAMQELKMGVASAEEETQAVMKVYSKEDYSVVNRFESKWVLCTGYMVNDVWSHWEIHLAFMCFGL